MLKVGYVLDKEAVAIEINSKILDLVNFVYVRSQERYKKLSKDAKKVIKELHGGEFDRHNDDIIEDAQTDFDYDIQDFNGLLDEMKSRDVAYMVGMAECLLFTIKSLDIEINKRAYNLLRYLLTERNDVNSDDSDE